MPPRSHGTGRVDRAALRRCPESVVIEEGALIFHPENVSLDEDVYVGHYAILKGYFKNELVVGRGTWIGQGVFIHAAGGVRLGADVGIGPNVSILTSTHAEVARELPIMRGDIETAPVVVEDGSDVGVGAILLPGVTVGKGAQIGAGAVVTKDVAPYAVVAGNPARVLRWR